jgi:hypothetical protein
MLAHTILTFHVRGASEGRRIIMSKSDDTISRQKAIEAFQNVNLNIMHGDAAIGRRYYMMPKEAVKIIENLPSAEPPWIPCSKKLPEKEGPYLVSNSWHTFEAMFLEGEWYSRKLDLLLDGVLAWMPLPTLYKGGTE